MDNITSKTPYRNPKNKSAQDQNHKKKNFLMDKILQAYTQW